MQQQMMREITPLPLKFIIPIFRHPSKLLPNVKSWVWNFIETSLQIIYCKAAKISITQMTK